MKPKDYLSKRIAICKKLAGHGYLIDPRGCSKTETLETLEAVLSLPGHEKMTIKQLADAFGFHRNKITAILSKYKVERAKQPTKTQKSRRPDAEKRAELAGILRGKGYEIDGRGKTKSLEVILFADGLPKATENEIQACLKAFPGLCYSQIRGILRRRKQIKS